MPLEQNLFPNPALANNATGWASVLGGYARSTAVDAALPRATGFEGTAADDATGPRAQVTAGQQYVFSVSIAAQATQAFGLIVNFYAAASGGTFVAAAGSSVQVNLSAGQSQRYILGPYTVPSGAVSGNIKFNDIDAGGVEITAIRCAPYSGDLAADGAYFDGASPGASWDGTAGDSTSTRRVHRDTATATDSFSFVATAAGPVMSDAAIASDAFGATASGVMADAGYASDGFLIAQLEYDAQAGRVRVSAFTFDNSVTQARVRRRTIGGKWEAVRGGVVDTVAGYMIRPVDDYEYPAGVTVEYEIAGLTDSGVVRQSAIVRRDAAADTVWLKFVANPDQNRRVDLVGWGEIARPSRADVFDVVGASEPVVVTDKHGSRRVTVQVVTHTVEDTKSLDDALSQGYPLFFQVPVSLQLPTLYAVVGDYTYKALKPSSVRSMFTLPLTEVSAPPADVIPGAARTWQTILDQYPTWQAFYDAYDTWREALIG